MNKKVYVLIDAVNGDTDQVVNILKNKQGVVTVDYVEGPPDVIMVMKAKDRQQLAKLTINALLSVEGLIEGVKCLPVSKGAFNISRLRKRLTEEGEL